MTTDELESKIHQLVHEYRFGATMVRNYQYMSASANSVAVDPANSAPYIEIRRTGEPPTKLLIDIESHRSLRDSRDFIPSYAQREPTAGDTIFGLQIYITNSQSTIIQVT